MTIVDEFQFLLVRLKAACYCQNPNYKTISIPTGTIKSWANFHQGYACEISIPTGTIKSDINYILYSIKKIFQFLLVRLKVQVDATAIFIEKISIPTGTIKSACRAYR